MHKQTYLQQYTFLNEQIQDFQMIKFMKNIQKSVFDNISHFPIYFNVNLGKHKLDQKHVLSQPMIIKLSQNVVRQTTYNYQ